MADEPVTSSSVTPHPFVSALERVTATFKSSMQRMGDEVRSLKSKIESLEQEQRSTPALATQPTIDTDALVAQVAARVPPPDIDAIVKRAVSEIPVPKDGQDGKDAEVDITALLSRVVDLAVPEVLRLIPKPDEDAIVARIVARIPVPKDGEDGAASPEEIRAIAREEVLTNQRDFYKGVFVEGQQYRTADAVTWDGSLWFAQRDTKLKPGDNNPDWKLGVKKGRDGRK